LWTLTRRLRLSLSSTVNVFVAYYFGRRPFLRKFAPETLVIDIPEWGKIPIRANGEDTSLLRQILVDGEYNLPSENVRRVVDLGANIGLATVFLSRRFPDAEIACVEPSPQNIPLLKRVIAMNGIRACVFEAAIGPVDGSIDLFLSAQPDCTSVVNAVNTVGIVKVPQISMEHLMKDMGWEGIDVMKLDIEGAEKFLLTENQAWLGKVRMVVGESHANVGHPLCAVGKRPRRARLRAQDHDRGTRKLWRDVPGHKLASSRQLNATSRNLHPLVVTSRMRVAWG